MNTRTVQNEIPPRYRPGETATQRLTRIRKSQNRRRKTVRYLSWTGPGIVGFTLVLLIGLMLWGQANVSGPVVAKRMLPSYVTYDPNPVYSTQCSYSSVSSYSKKTGSSTRTIKTCRPVQTGIHYGYDLHPAQYELIVGGTKGGVVYVGSYTFYSTNVGDCWNGGCS